MSKMLVKTDLSSKGLIFSYAKHLKGSKISIFDQLPKHMQSRRSAQLTQLKTERTKDPKAKLVKDTLKVGRRVIDPNFEKNPIKPKTGENYCNIRSKIKSTNIFEERGSKFQSHCLNLTNISDAQAALASVITDHPAASHRVYAYRLTDSSGSVITGHHDDGEWGASKIVMDELNQAASNMIIIVTRYFGGQYLGERRFQIFRMAAKAAVKQLQS